MKRGNKPYSVTFESLVMRLVKQKGFFQRQDMCNPDIDIIS